MNRDFVRLVLTFVLLLALGSAFFFWEPLAQTMGWENWEEWELAVMGRYLVGSLAWIALAYIVHRLVNYTILPILFEVRLGQPVPGLLRKLSTALVCVGAMAGIFGGVFGRSLAFIFAATGGTGVLVGLSLKALIADVFSGVILNLERPFKYGDYVEINGAAARIEDINWRSTTLKDENQRVFTIPNSNITSSIIKNWMYRDWRDAFKFRIDYTIPVERAMRILKAAALGAYKAKAEPKVDLMAADEIGITYRIRFWITDWDSWWDEQAAVLASVQRHLATAGIRVARKSMDFFTQEAVTFHQVIDPAAQKRQLLQGVELLRHAKKEDLDILVDCVEGRNFKAGETVVSQGDSGNSMYIVTEGLLTVHVKFSDQEQPRQVGQLEPGAFFGEMSLLTGEPRSATIGAVTDVVLYEITHAGMQSLFEAEPELVETLSEAMAGRKRRNEESQESGQAVSDGGEREETLSREIFTKIKGFFGLQ